MSTMTRWGRYCKVEGGVGKDLGRELELDSWVVEGVFGFEEESLL